MDILPQGTFVSLAGVLSGPPVYGLYLAEIIGTALLVLLGNGINANMLLSKTKGNGGGWIVITVGWGLAVFVGVFTVASISGAHINPAVTLGLAAAGTFPWVHVPGYVISQVIGGFVGATLVFLFFKPHYAEQNDPDLMMATYCTSPAIRNTASNFFSEFLGTFVLVFAILSMVAPDAGLGALDALPVALLVVVIGMGLGGTTGYAINPARDLGPRIAHALLPIRGKRDSDWGYAWIPVVAPLTGGAAAALFFLLTKLIYTAG